MSVEPFGNRDPKIIFEINNEYFPYFYAETSLKIEEDVQDYYLNLYDLTNVECDFFVLLNEEEKVIGVSGLLRSSYFSKVWFVNIAILPESLNDPNIHKLLNRVLDLTKKYLIAEGKEISQLVQLMAPSAFKNLLKILTDKLISPIEYKADLVIDFDKYKYHNYIPDGILIRSQTSLEEVNELIMVANSAFASHFNYEPMSIDDPSTQQSNYKFEQGELERIFAFAGDEMVGYITFLTPKSSQTGILKGLAVKPQSQGRGIGTALLHHGIKRLKDLKYQSILLNDVFYSNKKALELYLRLGSSIIPESKLTFYSLSEFLLSSDI